MNDNDPMDIDWVQTNAIYLRHMLSNSLLEFTKFFHRALTGEKLIVSKHHIVMCDTLEKVISGDIKNLIINLAPGYSKTMFAVIMFSAYSLARNETSKMLHTSYSDDLAVLNSASVKDIVLSEEFQLLFPQEIRVDSKAKKRWANTRRGGMYASTSNGPITGFRAGQMGQPGYSGALVIDDPVKPALNNSLTEINTVNERYMTTLKSRIAHPDVPIIVIMQRLHEDDLCGFLLKGGTKEKWHHLELPAVIPSSPREYPKEYTHGIPIGHDLPAGPLWNYKNSLDDLKLIELADKYTYACQYDQRPVPRGGGVYNIKNFEYYKEYDPFLNQIILADDKKIGILYKIITMDTALKTEEIHDFSVLQLWGYGKDNRIYLLDQLRGKWESYDLEIQVEDFVKKHAYERKSCTMGVRSIYCEDKASGTGLIQSLNRKHGSSFILPVQRNKDKVSRALQSNRWLVKQQIVIPQHAEWLNDLLIEFNSFTVAGNAKHDDQIDPFMDAIDVMLDNGQFTGYSWI